jgi:predicted transcriptional regulator
MGPNTKTSLLQIRLSDNDKAKLEKLAIQANISMSEWIRRAIENG